MTPDDTFHQHLDECTQCETHPFDLCPIGRALLLKTGPSEPIFQEYPE
jgi:hypothetical protein